MKKSASPSALSYVREIFKRYSRFFMLGGIFVAASALIYYFHYRIFYDPHHIFIYMIGDLGFLPLEAFIVVVVIERIFAYRDKQAMLSKLNMVIGAFFSEVGNKFLERLISFCRKREDVFESMGVKQGWAANDFKAARDVASRIEIFPHTGPGGASGA